MVKLYQPSSGDCFYFKTQRLAAIFLGDYYGIDVDYVSGTLKNGCRRYKDFCIRYE